MKRAIDNYERGKQVEVIAWPGQSIPASTKRFICPECMECVTLDKRGFFRHKNRTPESLDCEKRVDGNSTSPYEKMGIPIFLRENHKFEFSVALGFAGMDEHYLTIAEQANSSIKILGDKKKVYKISQERFSPNSTTYLDVDFLPEDTNYHIEYSEGTPKQIKRKWTNHSDTWGRGSFFKCSESLHRKIHSGGSVEIGTDYYFIGSASLFQRFTNIVKCNLYGFLKCQNKVLNVYKFKILNKSDTFDYIRLEDIFREKFKLSILVGESKLFPVWPPAIMENQMIFDESVIDICFFAESPNDSPKIYKYNNGEYAIIKTTKDKVFTTKIYSKEETPYSVDKMFSGNVQFIKKSKISGIGFSSMTDILDEDGVSITTIENPKFKNRVFNLITNFKAIVLIKKPDGTVYMHNISDVKGYKTSNLYFGDEVSFYNMSWTRIATYVMPKEVRKATQKYSSIYKKLCVANGKHRDIDNIIKSICSHVDDPDIYIYLRKCISQNRIPQKAYDLILAHYRR